MLKPRKEWERDSRKWIYTMDHGEMSGVEYLNNAGYMN